MENVDLTVKPGKPKVEEIVYGREQRRPMLIVLDLLELRNVKILPALTHSLERNGSVVVKNL
tara:strand:- start:539 stop:724 length:186 start_codon:yes stop_codon:yes gene_type:complete